MRKSPSSPDSITSSDAHLEKTTRLKMKKSSRPLREVMDDQLYQVLLKLEKKSKHLLIHHYRFKLYLIVARHTGLRAGDIGTLTKKDFEEMQRSGKLIFQEEKTGTYRTIILSENALKELEKWNDGIEYVFQNQETLMGTRYSRNWLRFLNKNLADATKDMNI